MTRLGSFVRENDRPARRLAEAAFDTVVRPATGSSLLLARLDARAEAAGGSAALRAHAASVADTHGVRTALATYRLLARVGSGDRSGLTPLFNKLQPDPDDDLMWDTLELAGYDVDAVRDDPDADLVEHFHDEISRGFRADGFSQVFEWLLTRERVPADSAAVRPLLEELVTSAVAMRNDIEESRRRFELSDLDEVLRAISGAGTSHDVFVGGASLLALRMSSPPPPGFGGIEFGSFSPLDQLLADLPNELTLLERQHGQARLRHGAVDADVLLVHVEQRGDRACHGNGRYTRWYTPFETQEVELAGRRVLCPGDVDTYLDERFGDWRSRPFFYDAVLDAPNTTIDRSLAGLLFAYSNLRLTFERGRRHYADEWSEIMRDRFGIDYSNFVPRGIHRKVLATPPTAAEIGDRRVRLALASYDRVDAEFTEWLEQQCADGWFLIAGVPGDRHDGDANERLALANSLKMVSCSALIETDQDRSQPWPGIAVDDIVVHSSAAPAEDRS